MGRELFLVDDDDDMLDVVGEILRSEGYEVRAFPSGKLAIHELCAGARPAAILLDFHLADTCASEVLDAIDERAPVPVLLLSGAAGGEVAEIAPRVHCVLQKPVALPSLLDALASATRTASKGSSCGIAGAAL